MNCKINGEEMILPCTDNECPLIEYCNNEPIDFNETEEEINNG